MKDERIERMAKKPLFFTKRTRKRRYLAILDLTKQKRLPPDLDDISTNSFILKRHKISFDNNLQLVLKNRNQDNLFLSFIINKEEKYNFAWLINKFKDYIDAVVNANVLLYLGENDPRFTLLLIG